jgi:predicted O-methyltransferase YrrM
MTNDEKLKLHSLALSLKENSNIVEIGSYLGASSCCIASGIKDSSKLYCIDSWNNDAMSEGTKDTFNEFMLNTKEFENVITPIRGMSYNVIDDVAKLTNNQIDMLFIDGDHSYGGVKKDWDLYSPLLKSGSIVIFHDIAWADGVKKVVRENVKPLVSKDSNFELPNMYWAWIK